MQIYMDILASSHYCQLFSRNICNVLVVDFEILEH